MPNPVRRRILRASSAAAAFTSLSPLRSIAQGQPYPARPLRIVIPFPPGGPTDIAARLLADAMAQEFGQPVIADNRPGAAGNIAAQAVTGAAPDGYSVLFSGSGSHGINPALFAGKLPFDAERDFTPIVLVSSSPNLISAGPRFPGSTLVDFIRIARERPGALNVGIGSLGTTQHMAVELLKMLASINVTIIPYKGAAPAMQDLLGGTIDVLADGISASLPQVRAGRIKALGVTSPQRVPSAPDIPSIAETLPGFSAIAWFGLFGPAKLPRNIVDTINRAANAALAKPTVRERYAQAGAEVMGGTPEQAVAHARSEMKKWAEVVRATGARID